MVNLLQTMLDDEAAQDLWWEAEGVVNIYNWVESSFALNLPNVLFQASGGKIKAPISGSRMLFKGEGIGIGKCWWWESPERSWPTADIFPQGSGHTPGWVVNRAQN